MAVKKSSKKPILMVSSTAYQNEDLLDQIFATLSGFGYDVWCSHSGTMPAFSNISAMDACVEAVKNCDLFFGVISPRYGSGIIEEEGISITHKEIQTAIAMNKPRWFIAHDHVVFARRLLKNLGHHDKAARQGLKYKKSLEMDDLRVVDMYEDAIRNEVNPVKDRVGNWVQTVISSEAALRFAVAQFHRIQDVQTFMEEQLAGKDRIMAQIDEKKKP